MHKQAMNLNLSSHEPNMRPTVDTNGDMRRKSSRQDHQDPSRLVDLPLKNSSLSAPCMTLVSSSNSKNIFLSTMANDKLGTTRSNCGNEEFFAQHKSVTSNRGLPVVHSDDSFDLSGLNGESKSLGSSSTLNRSAVSAGRDFLQRQQGTSSNTGTAGSALSSKHRNISSCSLRSCLKSESKFESKSRDNRLAGSTSILRRSSSKCTLGSVKSVSFSINTLQDADNEHTYADDGELNFNDIFCNADNSESSNQLAKNAEWDDIFSAKFVEESDEDNDDCSNEDILSPLQDLPGFGEKSMATLGNMSELSLDDFTEELRDLNNKSQGPR